jgi:hypothetical protein
MKSRGNLSGIPAHRLVQVGGADSIQNREVRAQHYARFADEMDPV